MITIMASMTAPIISHVLVSGPDVVVFVLLVVVEVPIVAAGAGVAA
jgi:hypothetical protein